MSLSSWLKSLFAPSPPPRPDYSGLPDERLVELWRTRRQLTAASVEALKEELDRRELLEDAREIALRPKRSLEAEQRHPGFEQGDLYAPAELDARKRMGLGDQKDEEVVKAIQVPTPNAVLLWMDDGQHLLCVFPIEDEETAAAVFGDLAAAAAARSAQAMLLVDPAGEGFLPTSFLAARLGIPLGRIYAVADGHPFDRAPAGLDDGRPLGEVTLLGDTQDLGGITLERVSGYPDAVRAGFADAEEVVILLGLGMDLRALGVEPTPSHVIGGVEPASEEAAAHLDAVLKRSDAAETLRVSVTFTTSPGVDGRWQGDALGAVGAQVTVIGVTPQAIANEDEALEPGPDELASDA